MRNGNLAALLMALTLAVLGASTDAAEAPGPKVGPDLGANAALQYWQAFALMPALDTKQQKRIQEWDKDPLDATALTLVAASEESRRYLLRGAKLRGCDWGLDYEDGIMLLLPHLNKAREVARLVALHARRELEQGHVEAAAEDARAILALGRHVGSEPIVISILVCYSIEANAVDLLASYLPEMQALAPGIVSTYEALPPAATLQRAYLTMEKELTLRWLVKKLKEAEASKKGAWRDVWKNAVDRPGGVDTINRIDSFEQAVKLTEDLLPVCDELATLVALPAEEFDARYPEFKKKTEAAHPLVDVFLTTPDGVLFAQRRNQVRRELLKAAIAVVRGGPEKLAAIKDPFGTGPFAYRRLDKGFELKSKLVFHDQPVSLTVGQGMK